MSQMNIMSFSEVDKSMAKRTLKHYCSSWDELRYDEIRNKPYFIGKRLKDSTTEILFPIDCHKAVTFDELKSCILDSGSTSVNLAIYNSDSTVVLYKAELGLKPPVHVKENETCSVSNASITLQCSESVEKRKIDSAANSPVTTSVYTEQSETSSTTDCLQIDLQSAIDSDLSETENEDSEKSNNC